MLRLGDLAMQPSVLLLHVDVGLEHEMAPGTLLLRFHFFERSAGGSHPGGLVPRS